MRELREKKTKQRRLGKDLGEEEKNRLLQLEEDMKVARNAFDKFLADMTKEIEKVGVVRAKEIGEKNLKRLRSLQGTLRELGHGAVTVHYLITADKLRIILTTPDVQLVRIRT